MGSAAIAAYNSRMTRSDGEPVGPRQFATTHWSVVLAARASDAVEAREALARLCEAYWYPLYAYIRRAGYCADMAQDLTQEFFARLLERDFLAAVDQDRGRFRSFLLAACRHFLANERDRERAQKRGGGRPVLSFHSRDAETRYSREPVDDLTPDRLFERRWALTLLDRVLGRLREEYCARGKGEQFDWLRTYLVGDRNALAYAEVARKLGTTPGAIKVLVHRLRQRYRELLHEEIAPTVETPEQVDEEIRQLFTALGG
jgi:RNA polymerase sigma-70 factor (ECF subfamily)